MNKNILVGGAWPYANGSLHIGHIAALLPADVIARYHRAKGDHVVFVSGSDCNGTPVAIRAKQEGKTPEQIVGILKALNENGQEPILVTRLSAEKAEENLFFFRSVP